MSERCNALTGWRCTREAEHEGPCAAIEDMGTDLGSLSYRGCTHNFRWLRIRNVDANGEAEDYYSDVFYCTKCLEHREHRAGVTP